MIKDLIIAGIVFVVVCVIAVKYKSWFTKTSTQVDDRVETIITNVENRDSTSTTDSTPKSGS